MRLHRFIGNFRLKSGDLKIEDKKLLNQLRSVLKLRIGEKMILGDGNINEGMAEIKEFGKDYIKVEVREISTNKNEPLRQVALYCAILKWENFELVVQKATEIGVGEIIPIVTGRTVKLNIRPDRLRKIIKEAAEQSGRGVVPTLRELLNFESAVENAKENGLNLFFDQSGQNDRHRKTGSQPDAVKKIGVFIGPEGGWTVKEVEMAKTVGFEVVSLGSTILRAETAAIVGSYLAIHNLVV